MIHLKHNSLWSCWQNTAKRLKSNVAVIEADTKRQLTFSDLTSQAEHLANQLPSNLSRQSVAFCMPNSIEWLVRFLALQKLKAVVVPLDYSLSLEAQIAVCRDLQIQYFWPSDSNELKKITSSAKRTTDCIIKLTSGSVKGIKTVYCQSKHLLADGVQILQSMGIRRSDCNLALIPLGHSYGLGNLVMPLLIQGTSLVCVKEYVPRQILELISKHNVTVFPGVPALFRILSQIKNPPKIPSLRLVISAGAPLTSEVAKDFRRTFGKHIHNFYGSSETGGICYDRSGLATLSGRSVGTPLKGVSVRIQRNKRVAVKSKAVAISKEFVVPDLGEWASKNELRLIGRMNVVANIAGKKVHGGELEGILRNTPSVSDAWVIVLKDPHGTDYLAAAIETCQTQSNIEKQLLKIIPPWKLPKRYLVRERLPRNLRGKLDALKLRELLK